MSHGIWKIGLLNHYDMSYLYEIKLEIHIKMKVLMGFIKELE